MISLRVEEVNNSSQTEFLFINRNCALKNRYSEDVVVAFISMDYIGFRKNKNHCFSWFIKYYIGTKL